MGPRLGDFLRTRSFDVQCRVLRSHDVRYVLGRANFGSLPALESRLDRSKKVLREFTLRVLEAPRPVGALGRDAIGGLRAGQAAAQERGQEHKDRSAVRTVRKAGRVEKGR